MPVNERRTPDEQRRKSEIGHLPSIGFSKRQIGNLETPVEKSTINPKVEQPSPTKLYSIEPSKRLDAILHIDKSISACVGCYDPYPTSLTKPSFSKNPGWTKTLKRKQEQTLIGPGSYNPKSNDPPSKLGCISFASKTDRFPAQVKVNVPKYVDVFDTYEGAFK
jgi:hypothetical protein